MAHSKDLTGMRFGRLVAIKIVGTAKSGHKIWLCKCDCGNDHEVTSASLQKGSTSCGCYKAEYLKSKEHGEKGKTHGMTGTRIHRIWLAMNSRCNSESHGSYHLYGGIGIKVCAEWSSMEGGSFVKFYEDMIEGYSDELELDRIDPYGNYCKENCRWATRSMQVFNRRLLPNNKSGRTGVRLDTKSGKWVAEINKECLGYFAEFADAVEAREQAELERYGFVKEK